MIEKISTTLQGIQGIRVHGPIQPEIKEHIKKHEEQRNQGVHESLKRQHVILITHDTTFRYPQEKQIVHTKNDYYFPGLPFPEVQAKNVISGSPSKAIHKFLIQKYNIHTTNEDATLLIGFDLEDKE